MRWSIMGKLASSLLEFGGSPVAEQGEYDGPHPSGLASRGCPAGAPVVGGEGCRGVAWLGRRRRVFRARLEARCSVS